MTKEEYAKLLASDYWKGYSYSLIKERNYICNDCGRQFINQRNMLQVHHLHYRDANPWSYDPNELVVLCRDCHERRHGIYKDINYTKPNSAKPRNPKNNYEKPVSWTGRPLRDDIKKEFIPTTIPSRKPSTKIKRSSILTLMGILVLVNLLFMRNPTDSNTKSAHKDSIQGVTKSSRAVSMNIKSKAESNTLAINSSMDLNESESENLIEETVNQLSMDTDVLITMNSDVIPIENNAPTIKEDAKYRRAVKKAKRLGVSTEGTTEEILQRINELQVLEDIDLQENIAY